METIDSFETLSGGDDYIVVNKNEDGRVSASFETRRSSCPATPEELHDTAKELRELADKHDLAATRIALQDVGFKRNPLTAFPVVEGVTCYDITAPFLELVPDWWKEELGDSEVRVQMMVFPKQH